MVATVGRGWRLAPSAERAVLEADAIAPHRSRASDGSIGDAEHAARSSFHNPQDGYVDAVDITHDPEGGFDAHAHADDLVASKPDHLDHVISKRRIASAVHGWVWRKYTGPNAHDKHIHIANKRTSAGRNFIGSVFSPPSVEPAPKQKDGHLMHILGITSGTDAGKWFLVGPTTFQFIDNDPLKAELQKVYGPEQKIDGATWGFIKGPLKPV